MISVVAEPAQTPDLAQLPPPPPGRSGWPWTEQGQRLPATLASGRPWPRISIVTASYNQGRFVEETLRSVLLQGYPNLEYLVLDGGSTDESLEIIDRYKPWLSYVLVDPAAGYTERLRLGLERSTGTIQAWLNTDDVYQPGALARVASAFEANPRAVLATGDAYHIDAESRRQLRFFAQPLNLTLTANLGWHRCPQPGCFWRSRAYQQVGGVDTALRYAMDRDLYLRLAAAGQCIRVPGAPVASFRQHAEARSSTALDLARHENALLIEKYGDPRIRARYSMLRLGWFFWSLLRVFRERLQRAYGWEF